MDDDNEPRTIHVTRQQVETIISRVQDWQGRRC
jgi:hypothetical protein